MANRNHNNSEKRPSAVTRKRRRSAKDRILAKAAGLGVIHYRVLSALVSRKEPLSYREIEKATGYYSVLAGILQTDRGNDLVSQGLATPKKMEDNNGRERLFFFATAKGKKLVAKAMRAKE